MQALMLIACGIALAVQLWTSYLLRERSPTIRGVWRAARFMGHVAFYGFCIAFVALPTFPKWILFLLLTLYWLETAAENYYCGIRRID